RSRKESPVEKSRIIARTVFAIFTELDGKPVVRAAMDALEEALDRHLGPHLETLDPHQRLGINERPALALHAFTARKCAGIRASVAGEGGHQRRGPFTSWSKRSMTESTEIPSASAR